MAKSSSFSQRQERLNRSVMAKRSVFADADESMQPLELYFGPKEGQVVQLELARIASAPDHPRQSVTPGGMEALTRSIRTEGLLSPILVRQENNKYVVVAGERRLQAHQRAGFEKIRALIDASSPDQAFERSLIENLQRESLTPLDEAAGVSELIQRRSYSQQQAGDILGRSKTHICKLLRINRLAVEVKETVRPATLGLDQLYQIARQKTAAAQMHLARLILSAGLNTRQTRQATDTSNPTDKIPLVIQHVNRLEKAIQKGSIDQLDSQQRQALKKRLLALVKQL